MNILEGNKLLASFMGETGIQSPYRYDKDWNRLIPVIEKIGTIHINDPLALAQGRTHYVDTFRDNMFRFYCMGLHGANTLIQAAWNACVEFAQYYNEQPKDN
jgi:hypothetical protein